MCVLISKSKHDGSQRGEYNYVQYERLVLEEKTQADGGVLIGKCNKKQLSFMSCEVEDYCGTYTWNFAYLADIEKHHYEHM